MMNILNGGAHAGNTRYKQEVRDHAGWSIGAAEGSRRAEAYQAGQTFKAGYATSVAMRVIRTKPSRAMRKLAYPKGTMSGL